MFLATVTVGVLLGLAILWLNRASSRKGRFRDDRLLAALPLPVLPPRDSGR